MRSILASFLTLGLLVVTVAARAETKVTQIRFENYPKSPAGCHATAAEVGQKFVAATSQGTVSSRCLSDEADGYTLQIEHRGENSLPYVSTVPRLSAYPVGQYKTRAACDAELTALTQTFESETGLRAAFAYCDRDSFSRAYPWYAHLDAFGTTGRPPRLDGFLLFSVPVGYAPGAFPAEIQAALSQPGVKVTHVRTHPGGGTASLSIHYYALDYIHFDQREITKTYGKNECESQLGVARAELGQFENPPLIVYCGKTILGSTEMTVVYQGVPDVLFTPSAETFKTFAECRAGRDALIRKYQTELKIAVLGGACTMGSRGFRVQLFEKK